MQHHESRTNEAPVVAVTGGSGLVGAALVRRALAAGYRVRALSRSVPDKAPSDEVQWVSGRLGDPEALKRLCAGARFVFHTAAHVDDWGPAAPFWETNCEGTERVCAAALSAGVRRFVHVSTVDVFGFEKNQRVNEACRRVGYSHPYSASKLAAEELVWRYGARGLPVSVVYPTWVFGPGDRHLLPTLLAMLSDGSALRLDGGRPHFEATYSDNLADACILIAKTPSAGGEGYIVGDDYGVDFGTFLNAVARAAGREDVRRSLPSWFAVPLASMLETAYRLVLPAHRPPVTKYALVALANGAHYDLSKLKALGHLPRVAFEEAIRRAVEGTAGSESDELASTRRPLSVRTRDDSSTARPAASGDVT